MAQQKDFLNHDYHFIEMLLLVGDKLHYITKYSTNTLALKQAFFVFIEIFRDKKSFDHDRQIVEL
jgi:hypothetical protein